MTRLAPRLLSVISISVLAGLLLAVESIAAPGGGSSGFGGGGGGGGGSGGFSGGGGAGSGSGGGSPLIILVVFVVVAVLVVFGLFKAARLRKRRRERAARVELASAEAAGDDAYFAADLVKAEAAAPHRSIVAAWTGRDRAALATLLGPDLVTEWVNTRLVVRGPRLQVPRIAALDAQSQPPAMVVEAELRGRRYLEDRDTAAVLEGSKDRETAFTERWTLALAEDDPATPWRIVATAVVG